jgi:hypothetical protein
MRALILAVVVLCASVAQADLFVTQVGDGTAALAGTGTATFVKEFKTTGGTAAASFALPTTTSGSQLAFTLTGNSTAEGFITLSTDSKYLTIGGYNAAVGSATSTVANNRVVARIDPATGSIDTSTNLQVAATSGNIRSTVMDASGNVWAATSASGVKTIPFGTVGASTQVSSVAAGNAVNTRVVNIAGGQLYVSGSTATGPLLAPGTVGTGTPITGPQTITELAGFPTAAGPSNYDYVFASSTVLYVADDRSTITLNTGGLEKWTFDGSKWNLAYTIVSGLTSGLRGLAGTTDGAGNELLYATSADALSKLVSVADPIAGSTLPATSFVTLATASLNTAFRGVEFSTVPEVSAFAMVGLVGIGAVVLHRVRRRKVEAVA